MANPGTGESAPERGVSEADFAAEHARLALVTGEIEARLVVVRALRRERSEELVELRREFWDDMKLQADTLDAAAEAEQERVVLAHRERQHDRSTAELDLLARLSRSPYFARVDFAPDDLPENAAEVVYLGIGSFGADGRTQRVFDWRAPIASLYYDAVPGRAAYDAPAGRIAGQMLLKRQFDIRNGRLEHVADTDLTIGDTLLMRSLGRRGDSAMRSIVATIQKEQNRAIRDLEHRLVVVLGAAGSGKTSVGLQRVAFLLYRHRGSLDADQVVLFSPNPLFASFVSTVLPELGERNMRQVTFQDYLERQLASEFRVESPFGQLETLLTAAPGPALEARRAAIAYKASARFLTAIQRYADSLGAEGMLFRPLSFRGRALADADDLAAEFAAAAPGAALATRVGRMREGLHRRLGAFAAREAGEEWVDDELELVDAETHQAAYEHLAGRADSLSGAEYYREERAALSRSIVEQRLAELGRAIDDMRFVDAPALYLRFLTSADRFDEGGTVPPGWNENLAETGRALAGGDLPYEDATPLLYLIERVRGRHVGTQVRHVVVDEAQDYSHGQLDFLRRAFPFARMTLLGDPDQAVHVGGGALADVDALAAAYDPGEVAVLRLDRSYRPTREIAEFTRHLVAGGRPVIPFDRPGPRPVVSLVADRADLDRASERAVRALLADGCASLGVITKTAGQARALCARLPGDLGARLLTVDSATLAAGVSVLPGYLAKGLEFDGVVVHDASEERYRAQSDRSLLYAACTRAMHGLHLVAAGRPSPFLAAVPKDAYVT